MLQDLGRNLISGARLCFLLSVDRRDFRVSVDQAFLLLFLGIGTIITLDILLAADGGLIPLERVGIYALAIVTGLLGCFAALRLIGTPRDLTPAVVMLLAGLFWIIPVFAPLILVAGPEKLSPTTPAGIAAGCIVVLWFLVIGMRSVQRITGGGLMKATVAACVLVIFTALPRLLVSDTSSWLPAPARLPAAAMQENLYYGQFGMMDRAISWLDTHRKGTTDLYFVGFGADAREDVFLNEMRSVVRLFDTRFGTKDRSIVMLNHHRTVRQVPLANVHNLGRALHEIGKRMDPEEDVLFLYLSAPKLDDTQLRPTFKPLDLLPLHASEIRHMLNDAGIKWRIIVLSACTSDNFADRVADPNTLVITATGQGGRAHGCKNDVPHTIFGGAFFNEALQETFSVRTAFLDALKRIDATEKAEGLQPSDPKMKVGRNIGPQLDRLAAQLKQQEKSSAANVAKPPTR